MNRFALDAVDVRPGDAVLEIGFGPGVLVGRIARQTAAASVAGVDPSETMLDMARRRNRALVAAGRIELRIGSVSQIPYEDGRFDRVVTVNTIYFWPDHVAGLREVARVLKPVGRVVAVFRVARDREGELRMRVTVSPVRHSLGEVEGWFEDAGFIDVTSALRKLGILTAAAVSGRRE